MALSKRLRKNRGWLAFLALALVAGIVWYVASRSSKADVAETTYTTEAAAKGTLSVTVSGSGNLELASEREVYPKTSGTVDEIEVEVGDEVDKGDVLYTLDAEDAEAATSKALASYRQAQSSVAQASAQVTKAENSLDSLEERSDLPNSTVTTGDIKAAKAEVKSAKAQLSSAKSSQSQALSSYNDALDAEGDLIVKAPIAGTVWTVSVDEGDAVSTSGGSASSSATTAGSTSATSDGASTGSSSGSGSSTAPVTIAAKKPLVATLAINEVDLPSLKKDQRADLEFDALPDLAMTGKVSDIAREGTVSSGVVTFDVTVKLDVENKKLKPGMTVAATIVTDVAKDALLVSNSAVKTTSSDDGSYVLVMNPDGQSTSQLAVETGLSNDTQTEILSGLTEGQTVVTATSDSASASSSSSSNDGGGFMMMGGGPPSGGPGGGD